MQEVFHEGDGRNFSVHRRIIISIIVRKHGFYLSTLEIIIVRNQKNENSKETNQDLTFMEQIQKVLNYSRKFDHKYNVTFAVARIRKIVKDMKASNTSVVRSL